MIVLTNCLVYHGADHGSHVLRVPAQSNTVTWVTDYAEKDIVLQ